MTAIDTNVVVRLLTNDDARQSATAQSLFASGSIWITTTVLLEADWVLESLYGFDKAAVCDAFTRLLGLANVNTNDKAAMATAIALAAAGLDLADSILLTCRPADSAFVSFDEKLVRRAKRAGIPEISRL